MHALVLIFLSPILEDSDWLSLILTHGNRIAYLTTTIVSKGENVPILLQEDSMSWTTCRFGKIKVQDALQQGWSALYRVFTVV